MDTKPAVSAGAVTPLAVVNLGLTVEEAKKVQRLLRDHWGYYTDKIGGKVGPSTVMALQRWLQATWGYNGEVDGDLGPEARAAFTRMANACPNC
ncbi:hypothetical protein [Streptomyces tendae]